MNFTDQVAVVTGGASGIGRAVARLFSESGAKVIVSDINVEAAKSVSDLLPGESIAISTDVSKSSDVDALIDTGREYFGGVDILVHSAGIGLESEFLETTDETWQRLIDIDLSGTFYVNRAAGRHMKARGYGRIVNISSTAGLVGGTGRAAYGAAKGRSYHADPRSRR